MRKTIPIVSGNIKYLGLSIPEWVLILSPTPGYYLLAGNIPMAVNLINYIIASHVVVIIIYIVFISKLEDNIVVVIMNNLKIPNILYGVFGRPLPINKKNIKNDLYANRDIDKK